MERKKKIRRRRGGEKEHVKDNEEKVKDGKNIATREIKRRRKRKKMGM